VSQLGLDELVRFHGFAQTEAVCKVLANTLVLLMPSIEEQFGNAVLEAFAMGVPAIVAENCGVRDQLVRSGVSGFLVEPDNAAGIAYFMSLLGNDEARWRQMSQAAGEFIFLGDAPHFAEAVQDVIASVTNGAEQT
jgi:glycosyltransferase involved in cell wall biosynthesis